jgi:hypothetical protein
VVIELGEVRARGRDRNGTLTTAEVCDLFDRDLVDAVVFSTSTCGTTPGRGHDEERRVRERAAAVGVLDDPSCAWTRATGRSRYVPLGASGC